VDLIELFHPIIINPGPEANEEFSAFTVQREVCCQKNRRVFNSRVETNH